jgi:hypothetical protein
VVKIIKGWLELKPLSLKAGLPNESKYPTGSLFTLMLGVTLLSDILLNSNSLNIIMLCAVMTSINVLSVIMVNVIINSYQHECNFGLVSVCTKSVNRMNVIMYRVIMVKVMEPRRIP